MAVEFHATADQTIPSAGVFRLAVTITAQDATPAVLLCLASNDTFVRVCTMADFKYPTVANPLEAAYYRRSTLTIDFATLADADGWKSNLASALTTLQDDYQDGVDEFVANDVEIL